MMEEMIEVMLKHLACLIFPKSGSSIFQIGFGKSVEFRKMISNEINNATRVTYRIICTGISDSGTIFREFDAPCQNTFFKRLFTCMEYVGNIAPVFSSIDKTTCQVTKNTSGFTIEIGEIQTNFVEGKYRLKPYYCYTDVGLLLSEFNDELESVERNEHQMTEESNASGPDATRTTLQDSMMMKRQIAELQNQLVDLGKKYQEQVDLAKTMYARHFQLEEMFKKSIESTEGLRTNLANHIAHVTKLASAVKTIADNGLERALARGDVEDQKAELKQAESVEFAEGEMVIPSKQPPWYPEERFDRQNLPGVTDTEFEADTTDDDDSVLLFDAPTLWTTGKGLQSFVSSGDTPDLSDVTVDPDMQLYDPEEFEAEADSIRYRMSVRAKLDEIEEGLADLEPGTEDLYFDSLVGQSVHEFIENYERMKAAGNTPTPKKKLTPEAIQIAKTMTPDFTRIPANVPQYRGDVVADLDSGFLNTIRRIVKHQVIEEWMNYEFCGELTDLISINEGLKAFDRHEFDRDRRISELGTDNKAAIAFSDAASALAARGLENFLYAVADWANPAGKARSIYGRMFLEHFLKDSGSEYSGEDVIQMLESFFRNANPKLGNTAAVTMSLEHPMMNSHEVMCALIAMGNLYKDMEINTELVATISMAYGFTDPDTIFDLSNDIELWKYVPSTDEMFDIIADHIRDADYELQESVTLDADDYTIHTIGVEISGTCDQITERHPMRHNLLVRAEDAAEHMLKRYYVSGPDMSPRQLVDWIQTTPDAPQELRAERMASHDAMAKAKAVASVDEMPVENARKVEIMTTTTDNDEMETTTMFEAIESVVYAKTSVTKTHDNKTATIKSYVMAERFAGEVLEPLLYSGEITRMDKFEKQLDLIGPSSLGRYFAPEVIYYADELSKMLEMELANNGIRKADVDPFMMYQYMYGDKLQPHANTVYHATGGSFTDDQIPAIRLVHRVMEVWASELPEETSELVMALTSIKFGMDCGILPYVFRKEVSTLEYEIMLVNSVYAWKHDPDYLNPITSGFFKLNLRENATKSGELGRAIELCETLSHKLHEKVRRDQPITVGQVEDMLAKHDEVLLARIETRIENKVGEILAKFGRKLDREITLNRMTAGLYQKFDELGVKGISYAEMQDFTSYVLSNISEAAVAQNDYTLMTKHPVWKKLIDHVSDTNTKKPKNVSRMASEVGHMLYSLTNPKTAHAGSENPEKQSFEIGVQVPEFENIHPELYADVVATDTGYTGAGAEAPRAFVAAKTSPEPMNQNTFSDPGVADSHKTDVKYCDSEMPAEKGPASPEPMNQNTFSDPGVADSHKTDVKYCDSEMPAEKGPASVITTETVVSDDDDDEGLRQITGRDSGSGKIHTSPGVREYECSSGNSGGGAEAPRAFVAAKTSPEPMNQNTFSDPGVADSHKTDVKYCDSGQITGRDSGSGKIHTSPGVQEYECSSGNSGGGSCRDAALDTLIL